MLDHLPVLLERVDQGIGVGVDPDVRDRALESNRNECPGDGLGQRGAVGFYGGLDAFDGLPVWVADEIKAVRQRA